VLQAEIVSLDSMQVYRGLDIGTAKPTPAERARVAHHLIDLVGPEERYDVSRYLRDAEAALRSLAARGKRALFVGGTGLYLKVLTAGLFDGPAPDLELRARLQERARLCGLAPLHAELRQRDPASAARIHANDEKRVLRALEVLEQTGRALSAWQREWADPARTRAARIVGLTLDFERLEERIRARVEAMLDAGWSDEARAVQDGPGFGPTAIQALGYREVLALARGELSRAACVERITQLTRRFAKKQHTWYRSFPAIHWLDPRNETARAEARAVLAGEGSPSSGS
jgi:tRNA dimethylallyltransferase